MSDIEFTYSTRKSINESNNIIESLQMIEEDNNSSITLENAKDEKEIQKNIKKDNICAIDKNKTFRHIIQHKEDVNYEKKYLKIILSYIKNYFMKMKGDPKKKPKATSIKEWIWSWIAAVIGISLVAILHYDILEEHNLQFIIASFGASAVLIYGSPTSPLAQPRNFIGGHFISAIVGVTVKWIFQDKTLGVSCGIGVATAIFFMHMTSTIHPPGGATALIAIVSPFFPWAGYQYALIPVLSGSLVMLIIALFVNNLSSSRHYPDFWI